MKVLFINPVPPADLQPLAFHHGIGSLSAVLKKNGHFTRGLVISELQTQRIDASITSFNPDLVCFSCVSNQFELAAQTASHLAEAFSIPVVAGGIHGTIAPEEWLSVPSVTGVCLGEGEDALLELVEKLEQNKDYFDTRNFWFNKEKVIKRNELRPLIDDLTSLPVPDRDVFDFQAIVDEHPEAEFLTSRDCPYACSYCINVTIKELYGLRTLKIRRRTVDNVISEIDMVLTRYKGIRRIGFDDDIFTFNRQWVMDFCVAYTESRYPPYWLNARVNHLDEEMLESLVRSGCTEIRMGVESGDLNIRKRVLNRNISDEQIKNAFDLVKSRGIKTWSFNMVGFPEETEETLFKTIDLNKNIGPDEIFVSIFQPYRGTSIYKECIKKNLLKDVQVQSYFAPRSTLDLTNISEERLLYLYTMFRNFVNSPEGIYMGEGWHDWESSAGKMKFRWSEKEAEFLVDPKYKIKKLFVNFSCHHPDIIRNPVTVRLSIPDQKKSVKATVCTNDPVILKIKVASKKNTRTRFILSVDRTWQPSKHESSSIDERILGIKFLDIQFKSSLL